MSLRYSKVGEGNCELLLYNKIRSFMFSWCCIREDPFASSLNISTYTDFLEIEKDSTKLHLKISITDTMNTEKICAVMESTNLSFYIINT